MVRWPSAWRTLARAEQVRRIREAEAAIEEHAAEIHERAARSQSRHAQQERRLREDGSFPTRLCSRTGHQ
jgi:hypothetical protein